MKTIEMLYRQCDEVNELYVVMYRSRYRWALAVMWTVSADVHTAPVSGEGTNDHNHEDNYSKNL